MPLQENENEGAQSDNPSENEEEIVDVENRERSKSIFNTLS